MSRVNIPISEKLNCLKRLNSVEKCVMDAILDKEIRPGDYMRIAQTCSITLYQAKFSVKLLQMKGLIPS